MDTMKWMPMFGLKKKSETEKILHSSRVSDVVVRKQNKNCQSTPFKCFDVTNDARICVVDEMTKDRKGNHQKCNQDMYR